MAREEVWFNLPQAVVLEATRDIELVLRLSDKDPDLLLQDANRALGLRASVPLEDEAPEAERRDAFARLQEELYANMTTSPYLTAEGRVWSLFIRGVPVKARRKLGGVLRTLEPVEFTRLEPRGVNAIDKRTGEIAYYDLRVDVFGLIEKFREPAAGAAGSSGNKPQSSGTKTPKWTTKGDPVPALIEWARKRWGDDLDELPNSQGLLVAHRQEFGRARGINEKTMRAVRLALTPEKARRGGSPTHRV